jgi:cobalt-zinc-cadmium efflux system protein
MKTEKNILVAFLLNLSFSIFEFFGGIFTGSVAIISDAVHDLGDAASIGISFFLERKSKKRPDEHYTYGYARYSVLGSVITTFILLFGSAAVIYNAFARLITPTEINYNGMIIFAIVGVIVNFAAALFTREGDSLNQKAVNLHMLEDVLGWAVVLVGAIIMRFTNISVIDPLLSIVVSLFILINAVSGLKEATDVFLEKAPHGIDTHEITDRLCELEGVLDVHHVHVWSMDGSGHYATLHAVVSSEADAHTVKEKIREELKEHKIVHATIELEAEGEHCHEKECNTEHHSSHGHHHHHHHHH